MLGYILWQREQLGVLGGEGVLINDWRVVLQALLGDSATTRGKSLKSYYYYHYPYPKWHLPLPPKEYANCHR